MIITVSGFPGSGKSTIAQKLSEILGWERFYIGGMRREIACRLGLSLEELNKRDEQEFYSDKIVDQRIVELAETKDNIIIEGRTAWFFVPDSIKLYFDIDLKEGAKRIFEKTKRPGEIYSSYEETLKALKQRIKSDKIRYMKYYGIDCYDKNHYDVVINTTGKTIKQVLRETIDALRHHGLKSKISNF